MKKQAVALFLALCLCIFAISSMAQTSAEGPMPFSAFYKAMISESYESSAFDYDEGILSSPIYTDGTWSRCFFTELDVFLVVHTSDDTLSGSVNAVGVITKLGDVRSFHELCAYVFLALRSEPCETLTEAMHDLLKNDASLEDIQALMEKAEAPSNYSFSFEETPLATTCWFYADAPAPVANSFVINTDEAFLLPIMDEALTVERLEANADALLEYYRVVFPDIALTAMVSQPMESDPDSYMHLYLLHEGTLVTVYARGEGSKGIVENILLIAMDERPDLLVPMATLLFGAVTDFTIDDLAVCGYVHGERTLYDDFMSFLPALARDGKMLLYGIGLDDLPIAYIMGLPEGANIP